MSTQTQSKTGIFGALLLVFLTVGVIIIVSKQKPTFHVKPDPAPSVSVSKGRNELTFVAMWPADQRPDQIIYSVNNATTILQEAVNQIPQGTEWRHTVPYVPGTNYFMQLSSMKKGPMSCQIFVNDIPLGPSIRQDAGTVRCKAT